MSAAPTAASLRKVLQLDVSVAQPILLGDLAGTERRMVPITGGTLRGIDLGGTEVRGTILSGGSDIQAVRADGTIELTARYAADLGENGKLFIENTGIRRAARSAANEPPYFRGVIRFCAPPGRLQWLNDSIFVSSGCREGGTVYIDVFELC